MNMTYDRQLKLLVSLLVKPRLASQTMEAYFEQEDSDALTQPRLTQLREEAEEPTEPTQLREVEEPIEATQLREIEATQLNEAPPEQKMQPLLAEFKGSFLELEPSPGQREFTKNGHSIYESSQLYETNPAPPKELFAKFEKLRASRLEDSKNRIYYKALECLHNLEWVRAQSLGLTWLSGDSLWWVRYNSKVSKGRYIDPWPQPGVVMQFIREDGSPVTMKVISNSEGQIERKTRARNTGWVVLREY